MKYKYLRCPPQDLLGALFRPLGGLLGLLRASWEPVGATWAVSGGSWPVWRLRKPSCGPLWAVLGYLGAVVEAAWAVWSCRTPEQAKTSKSAKHIKTCGGSLPRGRAASMRPLHCHRRAGSAPSARRPPRNPAPLPSSPAMEALGQFAAGAAASDNGRDAFNVADA
eukprot:7746931-Pyramimonas_sp.AAC.1